MRRHTHTHACKCLQDAQSCDSNLKRPKNGCPCPHNLVTMFVKYQICASEMQMSIPYIYYHTYSVYIIITDNIITYDILRIFLLIYIYIHIYFFLVGGFNPYEKYELDWIIIPAIGENKFHVPNHQPDMCSIYFPYIYFPYIGKIPPSSKKPIHRVPPKSARLAERQPPRRT